MRTTEESASQRTLLLDWLSERDPTTPATTVETHISILGFQGERVYKLKKAVRFPFIDLSTPERRLADCEREVALNRRLAPDVYLGIEPVTDVSGTTVDHVVVMRRMLDAQRLSAGVSRGADVTRCVDALAELLAEFHARADTGGAVDAAATRDAVANLWDHQFAEYPAERDELEPLVDRYLAGRNPLFEDRIRAGRARDGHGDLLADDVFCSDDGPRVLDCLEFDDRLRCGDVLADVAFLAMDLEYLGCLDVAEYFLDRYRAAAHDDWPMSLRHIYTAYRAHVRAKVASLTDHHDRVTALIALAHDHLARARMRLVIVGGPPATGKSTMARAIGDATGWPVLRSDEIRKQLDGRAPTSRAAAPLDKGIYASEWTEATYESLCERARALLERGQSVVLDASWADERWRALAATTAANTASDLVALRCDAPVALARERAVRRSEATTDASDANDTIAELVAARFAAWPTAHRIDTTAHPSAAAHAALAEIGEI